MLSLDSPDWSNLEHAYGAAGDVPGLLRQLRSLPASSGRAEPWFSLWSSLAHQGDVYSASFAAVPHVVSAIARATRLPDSSYIGFPTWVEICRTQKEVPVPQALSAAYFDAIAQLPAAIGRFGEFDWDDDFVACAMAALAVAKGSGVVARAAWELDPAAAAEFSRWFARR